ncbi:hypothetical protein [Streptomyces sp. NBC_01615]|uniref:hypothetical protein n=1 Tax=Streptomyces sp. NBC_01615 TaxID=2975898 RepID=UPI00386CA9FA
MTRATGEIRSTKVFLGGAWPIRTQAVSHVGDACMVEGVDDFDLDDLNMMRRQYPDRRVTLDGHVITVWPASPA